LAAVVGLSFYSRARPAPRAKGPRASCIRGGTSISPLQPKHPLPRELRAEPEAEALLDVDGGIHFAGGEFRQRSAAPRRSCFHEHGEVSPVPSRGVSLLLSAGWGHTPCFRLATSIRRVPAADPECAESSHPSRDRFRPFGVLGAHHRFGERLSRKSSGPMTSCTSPTRRRFCAESIRSRRVRFGRLRRACGVGEKCHCHFRTTDLVCATASRSDRWRGTSVSD
jgi:hypothetical protein